MGRKPSKVCEASALFLFDRRVQSDARLHTGSQGRARALQGTEVGNALSFAPLSPPGSTLTRIVSLGTKIKQIEALSLEDVGSASHRFIASVVEQTNGGALTVILTEKQITRLDAIWERHFA